MGLGLVRFVGVPRAVIEAGVVESVEWKRFGARCLEKAKELCPVSAGDGGDTSRPHLRDTLEQRTITGSDPRLLIGSKEKGDVLGYVVQGTEPHTIEPVNARALRFVAGGETVFATHVDHPGHPEPNDFIIEAVRRVLRES